MDRSFLSDKGIIRASREFVCARLATYESKEEAEYLSRIFRGRSGQLENTVFCIMSPDGKDKLVRSGRSPGWSFPGEEEQAARDMEKKMDDISSRYPVKRTSKTSLPALPVLPNVRLALNVAACDNLPLVAAVARSKGAMQKLRKQVNELAWSKAFIGRFIFVDAEAASELEKIKGVKNQEGVFVIAPDTFGQEGKVLTQVKLGVSSKDLEESFARALALYEPERKETLLHNALGRILDVNWKTQIPVTDPGAPARRGRSEEGRSRSGRRGSRGGRP